MPLQHLIEGIELRPRHGDVQRRRLRRGRQHQPDGHGPAAGRRPFRSDGGAPVSTDCGRAGGCAGGGDREGTNYGVKQESSRIARPGLIFRQAGERRPGRYGDCWCLAITPSCPCASTAL
jgi:hypothetical protein